MTTSLLNVKAEGMMFTTLDSDNDIWPGGNCAGRGGWCLDGAA